MKTRDLLSLPTPPLHLLSDASLFLDLDGTLLEIAAHPEEVVVDNSLKNLLTRLLQSLSGRVAVVSGRPAAEVRDLLGLRDLAIAGSHGAESSFAGDTDAPPAESAPPPHLREELRRLAERHPGVLIETKPFGLAIHYRLAPSAAEACLTLAQDIAAAEGFELQPGKMVVEIKYHRYDKGDAVRLFMARAPMRYGRPLFIGDDLTDEAGFAAARALGGAGILVGPPRKTCATYGLDDVGQALRWLSQGDAVAR